MYHSCSYEKMVELLYEKVQVPVPTEEDDAAMEEMYVNVYCIFACAVYTSA